MLRRIQVNDTVQSYVYLVNGYIYYLYQYDKGGRLFIPGTGLSGVLTPVIVTDVDPDRDTGLFVPTFSILFRFFFACRWEEDDDVDFTDFSSLSLSLSWSFNDFSSGREATLSPSKDASSGSSSKLFRLIFSNPLTAFLSFVDLSSLL